LNAPSPDCTPWNAWGAPEYSPSLSSTPGAATTPLASDEGRLIHTGFQPLDVAANFDLGVGHAAWDMRAASYLLPQVSDFSRENIWGTFS
jgi:hypothetical protein